MDVTPIRTIFTLAITLLSATSALAAEHAKPAVGSWAFELSHDPQTVRCVGVTEALLKSFRSCERQESGFAGDYPVDVCTVSAKVDYMVFTTRARCDENRETQAANE